MPDEHGHKTKEEIQAEIETLREMKPKVRRFSIFGDDNWAKIEAQITVLEERLDEDDIYERWEDPDNPDENCDLISNARDARDWMIGKSLEPEAPHEDWESLIEKD